MALVFKKNVQKEKNSSFEENKICKSKILYEIIYKYKGYIFGILVIVLSFISILVQKSERENILKINGEEINKKEGYIAVYISGEVKNPGVYYLKEGARLQHLLEVCGGITEKADLNTLNLAQLLIDSDKVVVLAKKTLVIDEEEDNIEEKEDSDNKVNINQADSKQLQNLSGIGESTAKKIIEYRKKNPFHQIEDIMKVPGIGENKYEKIKDNICVN